MSLSYRVVSIGTLSRNLLWDEAEARRPAHATTILIRDRSATILVDPGLPAEVLAQRLEERTGLSPADIEVVFLTTFRPVHRRGLAQFSRASWLMHEPEIEAVGAHLTEMADRADERGAGDGEVEEVARLVEDERALLRRIQPADEKLTRQVHLFPTPGLSPGSAGLLLAMPSRTVVVAGDAVVTQDHCEAGRVFERVTAVAEAQQSFTEVLEIADEIVPGHDNLFRVAGR